MKVSTSVLLMSVPEYLGKHVIAVRSVTGTDTEKWREVIDGITVEDAKRAYDAGTHEMCQGGLYVKASDGKLNRIGEAQYAIRRKVKAVRRPGERFWRD